MKMIRTSQSSVQMFVHLLKDLQCCRVLGKYFTRIQSVLHRFQIILCKSWTDESLRIDVSYFCIRFCTFVHLSHIKLNLSRRVLLLSPT